ncbi:cbb3-type cytochrome c oxidase subunit III [Hephaestia caeni]|jgi:mono/diheme cytochrome c family protein|uniref:Cbb3-type cytochrome c oxidase subunit III n=1 Tax=Hephaestia caeni TaxID=645617 RepID=A0A397PDM8_9SPHN|nr:cytochrome c [Hephaestia caeni]RIA44274.1 cbb3-type cytochrome c oxidase subunit III [Hephaestia caeni]
MSATPSRLRHHLPSGPFIAGLAIIVVLLIAAFVWFGAYNIAADSPHTRPVFGLLESLRDRSITVHARGIKPPADLETPEHVSAGAGLYVEMCQGCHLGPGVEKTEISQGLYPQAPELAKSTDLTPAQQFWVIKHGVKLSAMPAWGKTHPDPLIWDMVAFIQKLPAMSVEQYKATIASAPEDHDEMMKDMPMMKGMPASNDDHAKGAAHAHHDN